LVFNFVTELLSFPAGKHDDQVDALGLIGQLLDRMVKRRKPEPVRPHVDTRRDQMFKRHQKAMRRLRELKADA
jgi:hypothetical protein